MEYKFGTDGIRNVANDAFTKLAYNIGLSLKFLGENKIIIGTDTRESNERLTNAIAQGAQEAGCTVFDCKVVPTPCLIYYSSLEDVIGVMITASHNPYVDNGIKLVYNGKKIIRDWEVIIEKNLENMVDYTDNKPIIPYLEIKDLYLEFLNKFKISSKRKVVLDASHGATYVTAEKAFDMTNCIVCNNTPNGVNINNGVGSTHIDYLLNACKNFHGNIGFAFDGDGDRVIAVEDGKVFDGDKLIYIIANYLKKQDGKNNHIVLTKMSNLALINDLKEKGITTSVVDVGDKYVLKELLDNNYAVGGENSGHIIIPEFLKTGDGVFIALFIMNILENENKTLQELTNDVIMYKDKMTNLKVKNKNVAYNELITKRVQEISLLLGTEGRVMVRPSGTENLVRISCQSKNPEDVDKYIDELKILVESCE